MSLVSVSVLAFYVAEIMQKCNAPRHFLGAKVPLYYRAFLVRSIAPNLHFIY